MHGGQRRERILASPNARDGRFVNLNGVELDGASFSPGIASDFLFGGGRRVPSRPLPVHDPRERWTRAPGSELRITWLGHSSLLLELGDMRILTDPVLGSRASPLSFAGPRRFHRAPVEVAELPPIDLVLLSHNHYDHLCRSTMRALAQRDVAVVTALGVGAHLEAFGFDVRRIHELDWFEHVELRGARFTALPAQHFSGRGLLDRNATLWASFAIDSGAQRLFFSGDTGFFPELEALGERYGPFDITMLEIGAFHPAWGAVHLGPQNATRAHQLLRGRKLLPIHWSTFDLALHPWHEPAETLFGLASDAGVDLILPELGLAIEPARDEPARPWWRRLV